MLDTQLSRKPYFDDYVENSQYYKILYKPGVAVQVRELNQTQSILQDQINKFGRSIYKEGSIIEDCHLTFDNKRPYVKITDTYANGFAFTIGDFKDQIIFGSNGLKAIVIDTKEGYLSQAPDTNTLYVKYLNSANYANGLQQSTFDPAETLTIRNTSNTVTIGAVSVASNTTNANVGSPTGFGYAMSTTQGVVFKKGTFLYVEPQTILITPYTNSPDNLSVGFEAHESIDTAQSNSALYDNAAGAPNYSAPGADRLKIAPMLVVRTTSDVSNTSSFFSLVDFKEGAAVSIRQTAQYSAIGTEMARRTYETNGDFVVSPFILTTKNIANTSANDYSTHVNLLTGRGLGYVEGYRVEYLNNNVTKLRKGNDIDSVSQQIVTANFGNYIYANEFSGEFGDSTTVIQVELHNVAKTSLTSNLRTGVAYSGTTKIGTAYVRGFIFDNGVLGTPSAQHRIYLFNVQMLAGANFGDVKSAIYYDGSVKGVADAVLTPQTIAGVTTYVARLQQTYINSMIFPFGQRAVVANGFNNTEFVYRRKGTTQFLTSANASITIPAAAGTGAESFIYSGNLSAAQENDFYIVATADGQTANLTGTVTYGDASNTANVTITGGGSTFLSDYQIGDYIGVGSALPVLITNIANNTYMSVNKRSATVYTANVHHKSFPVGAQIPFANRPNRSTTIAGSTVTFTLGDTPVAPFNCDVFYSINRSSTVPIRKIINRNVFVKIDCSNNAAGFIGPWNLGLSDVVSIDKVWIGEGSYANSGVDYAPYFKLDNGQRDTHYDLAKINLISNSPADKLKINSTLLVQLTAFTHDDSSGRGFFTANSYPIDDVNTANTNAITTAQIPLYTTSKGTVFDLRDCVDFRPFAANTAAVANTVGGATVNPSATTTLGVNPYLPAPDSTFQSDLQYYLQRIDRAALNIDGNVVITEGIPNSSNPVAPLERNATMTLGLIHVPPYPSLSTEDAKKFNRYDYAITTTLSQNKRFTMKDIGSLEKRIENIEYYTSLSLLEQSASNLLVRSTSTGQNRFQNGIFVDPFKGFDLSNTHDPKYYISMDPVRTELRPAFAQMRSQFSFDAAKSSGVMKHGELIMLNHTSNNALISANFASKYRNCVEGNVYHWNGVIMLDPPGTLSPDITTAPTVTNDLDLASNWINLQNAWGTQWGNWTTESVTSKPTLFNTSSDSSVTNADGSQNITTVSQNIVENTYKQQQIGTVLNTSAPSTSQMNLGKFVTSVSILPYLKAAVIRYTAHGLKPNTRLYAYFGNVPMSSYCAPTQSNFGGDAIYGGGQSGVYGDQIISDSAGNAYGLFYLPSNTFKSQDNDFVLTDIYDLTQGEDAVTTKASVTFYGSNLSIAEGESIINTRSTVLSKSEVKSERTIKGLDIAESTTVQYVPPPTPPQGGSGCGCKIICTKLYELGLMDEETFIADQEFGELLRVNDPAVYEGYIRWASTVVEWMSGNTPNVFFWIRDKEERRKKELEATLKITYRIATPWAQHMQFLMGKRKEDNLAGKMIMAVGKPVSRLVSMLPKSNKEKMGKAGTYSMLGLFFVLYSISKVFGGKLGFPKPINI